MRKLLLVFCLIGFIACSAQTDYVLEGSLGKADIYLQFSDDPSDGENRVTGIRYFYKKTLQDIELEGKFENQQYLFWFAINESFSLTKKKDGSFSGTWTNNKGKSLPVSLRPFVGKTARGSDSPLDQIKSRLIGFRKDSTSVFHGKKIDWYCETHSATPLFRLADGYPKSTLDRINLVLEKMHYNLAIEQLGCTNPYLYSNSDIEFDIRLGYLDDNLLGFELFGYYNCGGAHPSGGSEGILIDLHNGKNYDIDDVLAFDKSVVHQEIGNFNQFSKYRNDFFSPKLYALLLQQFHFKKPENEDDCDYTDPELWTFAAWKFDAKGISFFPSFPHALQPCVTSFLVPFDLLRVYKNPAFPYVF